MGFTPSEVTQNFFVDSVAPEKRGNAYSIRDLLSPKATKMYVQDAKMHDANFAFLSTTLAKLHYRRRVLTGGEVPTRRELRGQGERGHVSFTGFMEYSEFL